MSKTLPVEFHSDVDRPTPIVPSFAANGGDGEIVLRGAVSLCRRGWRLWGEAVKHRHRITFYVHARREDGTTPLDLESHAYEAVVRDVKPGNYELRITHVLSDPLLTDGPSFLSSFEARVEVR